MSYPTNEDRAARAAAVVQFYTKDSDLATHFRKDDGIDESDVCDVISDLLHYCNQSEMDWQSVLRNAKANFTLELKGG